MLSKKSFCAAFLALAVLFSLSCNKESEDSKIFTVNTFFGDVQIVSAGKKSVPVLGAALFSNDEIITGKNSVADILYRTDGVIRISPGTTIKVQSLVQKTGGEGASVSLSNGSVFVVMSKLKRENSFSVKTPTAVAAVRGTSFRVSSSAGAETNIEVLTGKMLVSPVKDGAEVEKASVVVDEKKAVSVDRKIADAASSAGTAPVIREIPKEESAAILKNVQEFIPLNTPLGAKPELKSEVEIIVPELPKADDGKETAAKAAADKAAADKIATDKAASGKARLDKLAQEKKIKEDAAREAAAAAEKERLIAEQKAKEAAKKQKQKEDRVQNIPSI